MTFISLMITYLWYSIFFLHVGPLQYKGQDRAFYLLGALITLQVVLTGASAHNGKVYWTQVDLAMAKPSIVSETRMKESLLSVWTMPVFVMLVI